MKRLTRILGIALTAALLSVGVASAASLGLTTGKLGAGSVAVSGCTSSSLTATRNVDNSGNVTQVNVLSVPQACAGRDARHHAGEQLAHEPRRRLRHRRYVHRRLHCHRHGLRHRLRRERHRLRPLAHRSRRRCAASRSSPRPPRRRDRRRHPALRPASRYAASLGLSSNQAPRLEPDTDEGDVQPDVRRLPTTPMCSRRTRPARRGGTDTTLTIGGARRLAGLRLHPLRPQRLQPPHHGRRGQRGADAERDDERRTTRSRSSPSTPAGARRP